MTRFKRNFWMVFMKLWSLFSFRFAFALVWNSSLNEWQQKRHLRWNMWWVQVLNKVIYSKYCKNYAYALAYEMSFLCFSLYILTIQKKKHCSKQEFDTFLSFMLIYFLVLPWRPNLPQNKKSTYQILLTFYITWDIHVRSHH